MQEPDSPLFQSGRGGGGLGPPCIFKPSYLHTSFERPKIHAREGCAAGQRAIETWTNTKKPLSKVFRERGI